MRSNAIMANLVHKLNDYQRIIDKDDMIKDRLMDNIQKTIRRAIFETALNDRNIIRKACKDFLGMEEENDGTWIVPKEYLDQDVTDDDFHIQAEDIYGMNTIYMLKDSAEALEKYLKEDE